MATRSVRDRCISKLHPKVLRTSGKMQAILAYLLETTWTRPRLVGITTTTDGFVLGQVAGDLGMNDIIGTRADYERNLYGVAKAAKLTAKETAYLLGQAGIQEAA